MTEKSFNTVTVHRLALENNFRSVQRCCGEKIPVMAMVKADGYGHGMLEAAKAFYAAGCRRFGVAELAEGVALRQAGTRGDIYVTIGFDTGDAEAFFIHQLIPVIYSIEAARALSRVAVQRSSDIGVHVKVDTGMSRLGILPEEAGAFLAEVAGLPGISIGGIMSHFPESDEPGSLSTLTAIEKFSALGSGTKNRKDTLCHIANSGAVLNFPGAHYDMVRAGIALYGYHPAGRSINTSGTDDREAGLIPALSFSSRVLQVKDLAAGVGISYGHTYRTTKPTRIAVIPVGYEDGYSRALSNKGKVLIKGQFAPVRGRVCMNMSMVDITKIDGVRAGDEVVLLGCQGEAMISADDIAAQIDSISYEVLCKIGNNNRRRYQAG